MDLNEIVSLVTNTGVTIFIIAYFIYRDFKFMTTLDKTLSSLVTATENLKDIILNERK